MPWLELLYAQNAGFRITRLFLPGVIYLNQPAPGALKDFLYSSL
jgi:hypothetical protein